MTGALAAAQGKRRRQHRGARDALTVARLARQGSWRVAASSEEEEEEEG